MISNDYDSGGGVESLFDRFLMDAISAINPFFEDVDYLLTNSPAPARATLNAAFGLEISLLGYTAVGPIFSKMAEAAYRYGPYGESLVDFISSGLPATAPAPTWAGFYGWITGEINSGLLDKIDNEQHNGTPCERSR